MRIEQHVFAAIDAFGNNKKDEALMNACFTIDGTARKLFGKERPGKQEYKSCIRQYWWLIEPFMVPGINLEDTRWTHLTLKDGNGGKIIEPDLADIIYHIFRCNHAHAKEIPLEFELLPVGDGYSLWIISMDGRLHMPERIIWALLGVSVFCKANLDIKTEGDYHLSWGAESLGINPTIFPLKDYWGKENELKTFFSSKQFPRVKIEGL